MAFVVDVEVVIAVVFHMMVHDLIYTYHYDSQASFVMVYSSCNTACVCVWRGGVEDTSIVGIHKG